MLNVLIVGAGIAGNALAIHLSRQGHKVTVVERFASLRATGLQIDLRGHGITVLKRMGLEDAFKAHSAPEQGMEIVDKNGMRRAYFPSNKPSNSGKSNAQNFTSEYEIMRGDLCRLLYDAAQAAGATFVFDDSIRAVESTQSEVRATFDSAPMSTYDIIVGADGVHSRTRALMLSGIDPDRTNTGFYPLHGQYIGYFNAPIPKQPGEEYVASLYMATGDRGVMTRRCNANQIQVYAGGRSKDDPLKEIRRGDTKAEKEVLRAMLRGAGWRVDEFLKAMDQADDFYCERIGMVKLDNWSNGRVVLLGDAAWCPTVNTGMGTTSAMVGAYILAGEIGNHCGNRENSSMDDLRKAFEKYETKFRPFMDQVQRGVQEDKGLGLPSSALGLTVFYWIAAAAAFFKVNIGKMMMKENIKGWELPGY